jgi:hypothetical protein
MFLGTYGTATAQVLHGESTHSGSGDQGGLRFRASAAKPVACLLCMHPPPAEALQCKNDRLAIVESAIREEGSMGQQFILENLKTTLLARDL